MPLDRSKSKEAFNNNVDELVHAWRKAKKIGTSHPKTLEKARKQAIAIAFNVKKGK